MRKSTQHDNVLLTHLGEAIRDRRLDIDMTQGELASKTNVHRTYITDVEGGHRNISILTYRRLTNALRCALSLPMLQIERNMSGKAGKTVLSLFGVRGGLSKASQLLHSSNRFYQDLDIVALELHVKAEMSKLQVAVETFARKQNTYPRDESDVEEPCRSIARQPIYENIRATFKRHCR